MNDTKIKLIYKEYILCIDIKNTHGMNENVWTFCSHHLPLLLLCRAHRSKCSMIPYRFEPHSAPCADAFDGQLFGDPLHKDLQQNIPQLASVHQLCLIKLC